jgi:hypothetical protein
VLLSSVTCCYCAHSIAHGTHGTEVGASAPAAGACGCAGQSSPPLLSVAASRGSASYSCAGRASTPGCPARCCSPLLAECGCEGGGGDSHSHGPGRGCRQQHHHPLPHGGGAEGGDKGIKGLVCKQGCTMSICVVLRMSYKIVCVCGPFCTFNILML